MCERMKINVKKQKSRLLEKKADLERGIASLTEAYPTPARQPAAGEGPHEREDVTTDFLEMQNEQSIMVTEQTLLTLVQNALQRLEDGTYGLCLECKKAIPPKRLEALPWAERCVGCETQLEQMYQSREEVYGAPQIF
jgi:RNA polymerase-binding transcription factor DksA